MSGMQSNIGPYELLGELGRGAMARVWRAWDPSLQREVAIKEPLFDTYMTDDVKQELGRRFVIEGRAAARLSHPGIVTIYAADIYDGRPIIVMEKVEGDTLSRVLEAGSISADSVLSMLDQLLDAVGYAHTRGVVHRDIKPDNIFVADGGVIKRGDFGIAHVDWQSETSITIAGTVLGAPGYMSPEQVTGGAVDARSDLFSVGVVAYEMLTGYNPFGASEVTNVATLLHRIAYEPARGIPKELNNQIPEHVRGAIMKALEKNPENRPQSAEEFKNLLHREVAAGQQSMHIESKPHQQNWLPYLIVVALGIALLGYTLTSAFSGWKKGDVPETVDAESSDVEKNTDASDLDTEEEAVKETSESSLDTSSNTVSEEAEAAQDEDQTSQATFPSEWSGSYEGHSIKDGSYVYVSRNMDMTVWSISDSGDVKMDCVISSDDPVHGYITCEYMLVGTINWEDGTINLVADQWIDKGGFEYMRDFYGTFNQEWTRILGESTDHDGGGNSSKWVMSSLG